MPGTPATSPRLAIPRFSNADAADFAADVNSVVDALDTSAAGFLSGTDAGKGSASSSNAGKLYHATDSGALYYSDGTAWRTITGSRGAVSITGTESRSNTAYGTLTTPDQVTGIVMPTNGLIEVAYQATWQESNGNTASAALFLGSNQVKAAIETGFSNHGAFTQDAMLGSSGGGVNAALATWPGGLISGTNAVGYTGDATTGQLVGVGCFRGEQAPQVVVNGLTYVVGENYAGPSTDDSTYTSNIVFGGPCYIFAAAGTYTVSVQFKASAGTVTASNRKLWVRALSYG